MKALAVIDKNLALGYKNDLLFHLPTDLAHFKKHTLGQTVVMGQKTLESMRGGKPLPGRNTLVLNIDAPTGKLCDVPLSKDQKAALSEQFAAGAPSPSAGASSSNGTSSSINDNSHYICYSFQSLDDFRSYIRDHRSELGDIVLSGGATIYRLLLDDCDELILSEVETAAPQADVYFPEFRDKFQLAKKEGPYYDGPLEYNICYYTKK